MQSIIFYKHPADIIKVERKFGKAKLFIIIGNNKMSVQNIKYLGKDEYKVFCSFPTGKVHYEHLISQLNIMLQSKEIKDYSINS
jgi:hypothetical protein